MANAGSGLSDRLIVAPEAVDGGSQDLFSVVVVVTDRGSLGAFLDSVAAQGLVADQVEVVLVDVTGDEADLLDALDGARSELPVRVLTLAASYAGEARAVGLAAARGANCLVTEGSLPLAAGVLTGLLTGTERWAEATELGERLDLVRALTAVVAGTPTVLDRRDRAVAAQVDWLRALIDDDPAQHAVIVDQARSRAVHDLPWAEINRGRARDLALLYCFVPFIDTSGLVAARRLRGWGVVTDVVSQDLGNVARVDEASLRIPAEVLDETRILPGRRHAADWADTRDFVHDALGTVADLEATKGAYRSVYSRAMAPAAHLTAAVLKLRSPQLRWVAEFSDPLLMNPYGETRISARRDGSDDWLLAELAAGFRAAGIAVPDSDPVFGWAESVAYAFADEIIFTNDHQRDFMLGYCVDRTLAARAEGIARVLHHPVPDASLYRMAHPTYPLDPDLVHIGYFGNFYRNRGLTEITSALEGLTLAERDRVRLHVFTSKPGRLTLELLERGLADVVRVSPMLGYLEYLNLITRFDVLMINDYATGPHYVPNPYLPAKLADYAGSGAKIWSLYEAGSVLSATDVDFASPLGDEDAACDVLHRMLER